MAKEKSEKDKAVEMLSEDNRTWLESWERSGWSVVISESLQWSAVKEFAADDVCKLENYDSLVVLLTVIEHEEYKRKDYEEVDTESEKTKISEKLVVRHLRVDLDDAAIQIRTNAMIDAMNDADAAELHFARLKDRHKSKMKGYGSKVQHLRNAIHARFEFQDVACMEIFDFEKFVVSIVRKDTDAIVEQRPMRDEERQREMFKAGKQKGNAA